MTNINKTEIAKTAASWIVGLGTAKIVNDIIENNVDEGGPISTIGVAGASIAIGSMAADATSSYTDRKIDEFIAWCTGENEIKDIIKSLTEK